MIEIYVTFDAAFNTWNVMNGPECIFYGDIFQVEQWLEDNKQTHVEVN